MEMTSALLVSRTIEVGALIYMVIHMECVDGEGGFTYHIYEMRKVFSKAFGNVLDKRAGGVVGDEKVYAVQYPR